MHDCQHQKELSLLQKDIGRMSLELDGLKHSMGAWMQQIQHVMETIKENLYQKQVEQHKENDGTLVEITSPRKRKKCDESSHEDFNFDELMTRAEERAEGDYIFEKKLLDEEDVEEKHDDRPLVSESYLNEEKRKQNFNNAAVQDDSRNKDCSVEEESSNQLSVFEVKDVHSQKRKSGPYQKFPYNQLVNFQISVNFHVYFILNKFYNL